MGKWRSIWLAVVAATLCWVTPVVALSTAEKLAAVSPIPTLDLQFQQGSLDPRITFARASSGTFFDAQGLLHTASSGVPRFSSPGVGGGNVGWFLEGAATNLALWSRDLTNVVWVVSALSSTAKDQVGIDGVANSASSFTAGASNATVLQTLGLGSASRTYSVFLKRLVGSGTVSITPDGTNFTTVVLTNSWQRFSVSASVVPVIGVKLATSGDKVAIDANQDEAGAFSTSPILTTNATATRAAESATMSGAGIVKGQLPLTVFLSAAPTAAIGAANQTLLQIDDGTQTNRITFLRGATTGDEQQAVLSSGSNWAYSDTVGMPIGVPMPTNFSISPNRAVGSFAGRLPSPATTTGTPIVPPGITTIRFGNNVAGTAPMFGILYQLAIRPYAQPTAVLATSSLSGMP